MSDNKMPSASAAVVLTLRGQRIETPRLPGRLAATRSVPADDDAPDGSAEFLPAGYLIPRQTIELRAAPPSRGSANTATPEPIVSLTVAPDEVVVLELADGGLLFTRGERLRDRSLSDLAPDPDANSTTRGVIADLAGAQISRVFTLAFGPLPPNDPVVEALGGQIEDSLIDAGARLVARAGVRGLVWAIESRLRGRVGLRRWHPDVGLRDWPFVDDDLVRQFPAADASQRLLVFIHDLASDTLASFGALQSTHTLAALERQFPGGLYGFEHVTLSRSPIDNALDLAKLLPVGAHVSFVTLGRGGLVADLLCMGEADPAAGRTRLPADDQPVFDELLAMLAQKRLVPERYLRVACPAQGTRLLGESLDAFLSGLLSLIGLATTGNPVAETGYAAFKRLVLEMVRHRAEAEVLPGLAPLMPDSPLTRLLGEAPARGGLQMAVLAGALRGGGLMQRAGLWLAGRVLAGGALHHDLLVDTPAMLAGLAARADAKVRLECGAEVTHFRYFSSRAHQRALRDWLCEAAPLRDMAFEPLAAVRAQLEHSGSGPTPMADTPSPASRGQASARSKPADTYRHPSHEGPRSTRRRTLTVSVRADDLRFLADPLMIGHYEQDPIAGPQAIVDRELLDHALSQRHSLGLYPGPIGTASAILPSPGDQHPASSPVRGAVIIGLGRFDQPLTRDGLTEAVGAGAMRLLLQVRDTRGPAARGLRLNTLLIGTNSSSSLSVGSSVEALVRGVLEANARFHETTGLDLRIERLQIVELYLDTAISAVYALNESERRQTLRDLAASLDTTLTCAARLERGDGARPRLRDSSAAGGNYWPRLLITDASPPDAGDEAAPASSTPSGTPTATRRAAVATRLRFLHVGQRARAEAVVQQRQPGLVEQLVRQQIAHPRWNPDFGRALFQLMVPHEFKDTVRHFERLVLVVDTHTANLPWELMLADDPTRAGANDAAPQALALRIPLVRQFATLEFRSHVRQSAGRTALVVGNPSLARFLAFFPGPPEAPHGEPADLPGAADEALRVAGTLEANRYEVTRLFASPEDSRPAPTALDVFTALYRQPWRLLHLCGHGVFALPHRDGVERTGVLLSDGVLITAAEVQAMEQVPELVFLNCCHLGQVSEPVQAPVLAGTRNANRLAASLARELIEIGVRGVVVAGWAVGDGPAQTFGETFYEQILQKGRTFGDAVLEARRAACKADPQDITWGAFQAYGDPGWRADPTGRASTASERPSFVAPDELLDELARWRVEATQRAERHRTTKAERAAQCQAVEEFMAQRCPAEWREWPEVQSALGATWYALGAFDRAATCLRAAIRGEQKKAVVPIRAIEGLINALTRQAQQIEPDAADTLLGEALRALDLLDQLAAGDGSSTGERWALRGSVLKQRAEVLVRRSSTVVDKPALERAIQAAIEAYAKGGEEPYPQLNALALQALVCPATTHAALAEQARAFGEQARTAFEKDRSDVWSALMIPEAHMVALLLSPAGPATEAHAAYRRARAEVAVTPAQLDSMLTHLDLLIRLATALRLRGLVKRLDTLRTVATGVETR